MGLLVVAWCFLVLFGQRWATKWATTKSGRVRGDFHKIKTDAERISLPSLVFAGFFYILPFREKRYHWYHLENLSLFHQTRRWTSQPAF
jgi:hypothetical protein